MKKFCCILVGLMLLCSVALAEVDLESMSFDELIDLREQITIEITSRPEWKEVNVPAGIYEIGVDIPAGHWTISPVNDSVAFNYGSALNETKTDIAPMNLTATGGAGKPETFMNEVFGMESVSIDLAEGNWIFLNNQSIFTPYIRPTLGF